VREGGRVWAEEDVQEDLGVGSEGRVVLDRQGTERAVRNEVKIHLRLLVELEVGRQGSVRACGAQNTQRIIFGINKLIQICSCAGLGRWDLGRGGKEGRGLEGNHRGTASGRRRGRLSSSFSFNSAQIKKRQRKTCSENIFFGEKQREIYILIY
jgi:hypothetical protein